MTRMSPEQQIKAEAHAFRRLIAHLRERHDVQNIDLMNLAGFCRNCLGDWYQDGLNSQGIDISRDEAKRLIYGMDYADWKKRYQKPIDRSLDQPA